MGGVPWKLESTVIAVGVDDVAAPRLPSLFGIKDCELRASSVGLSFVIVVTNNRVASRKLEIFIVGLIGPRPLE